MANDFLNNLLDAFTTHSVGEFIPRHDLSPVTRAMIQTYFDGSTEEAKRYADHVIQTHTQNPAWIKELSDHITSFAH